MKITQTIEIFNKAFFCHIWHNIGLYQPISFQLSIEGPFGNLQNSGSFPFVPSVFFQNLRNILLFKGLKGLPQPHPIRHRIFQTLNSVGPGQRRRSLQKIDAVDRKISMQHILKFPDVPRPIMAAK